MRFILEHPWLAFIMLASISFALSWTGLRDGKTLRVKVGGVVFLVAIVVCVSGLAIDTPTEHAKRVVYAFVKAVEEEDIPSALKEVHSEVVLVENWKGISDTGVEGVKASITKLHSKYPIKFNTILRFQPVERSDDVLVELSLLSRVSGIGTVPSRWRLLVMPDDQGVWKIYSIDAVEIMGRSYR